MDRKNIRREITIHVLACMAFLCLPVISSPFAFEGNVFTDWRVLKDLFGCVLVIGFFYINYYYLIPQFYFGKKYLLFGLSIFTGFLVTAGVPNLLDLLLAGNPQFHTYGHQYHGRRQAFLAEHPHNAFFIVMMAHVSHNLLRFLLVVFISLMLKINARYKQVQKEKLSSELSYLKSQINPHFLFNTLNSIYALAVAQSSKTPAAIVSLSRMMRYMLSEADEAMVPLEQELEYIRSYIELQTNRFGDTLELSLTIDVADTALKIAPLILISFIENAFKHGVNPEENSKIDIVITLRGAELVFRITNKKVKARHAATEQTGIGIENTLARLQLLYPGKHNISITEDVKEYNVLLIMQLQ